MSGAADAGATSIEVSLARDGSYVVCTVADDGRDRSDLGLGVLSPVLKSLTYAVGADLAYNRLLGRNQYSLILPEAVAEQPTFTPDPIDVLGAASGYSQNYLRAAGNPPEDPAPSSPLPTYIPVNQLVGFVDTSNQGRAESVAARRKSQTVAR